ncbi:NnrU family protein [Minwuia thermotolerans]|uniref:NnrU domain-containing protein n=1 Tax=Minwuia thermotolerans TaxID=2056226 RepID=A0A2M9FZ39_9PROT|nr:NnrU family protein [Minwuia thermotolerans]PJK28733.1 hypothetical protein CVT23_15460 [Minwuia thermotolerans]
MPVGEFWHLVVATAVFLAIHVIPSSVLRNRLTGALGEAGYAIAFSVLSIAALLWMVLAFNAAPPGPVLWMNHGVAQYVTLVLMFVALLIGVGGLIGRSPTAVGGGGVARKGDPATGFLRITRHPFLTGVVLWSVAHLIVRGDLRAIVFFGGLGLLAAAGTVLIDRKSRRRLAGWERFAAVTSIVPFLAIIQGRNRLVFGELRLWRLAIGFVVFMAILHAHPYLMGTYPLPG